MKKLIVFIIISVLILVPGCQSSNDEELDIKPAPIHEVTPTVLTSLPPQISIYIKGGLSDGCTTFHRLETKRDGNTVTITVTTQRPRDAACTQVYGYFERDVNLGSDFISGETYTVNVNDMSTSFVMP
jgi:inhibitor of cysteine peptidase